MLISFTHPNKPTATYKILTAEENGKKVLQERREKNCEVCPVSFRFLPSAIGGEGHGSRIIAATVSSSDWQLTSWF